MNFTQKTCLLITVLLVNTIPYKAVAQEPRNPFILYPPAIQAAVMSRLYVDCINRGGELCGEEENYCIMSKEEKMQAALTRCYEIKLDCLVTCDNDYTTCKENGGTGAECSALLTVCDQACADQGTQCTIDAIDADYAAALSFDECEYNFTVCYNNWIIKCKTFYHR